MVRPPRQDCADWTSGRRLLSLSCLLYTSTKESIIEKKILPYFQKRKLCDITAKDVIEWQNEIRELTDKNGKKYSQTYLKTVHNQLSALFNHAVRYYGLKSNPAAIAGNMGTEERKEMLFWTLEEYKKFSEVMMDKPISYYAFQMLYWCGIREGEMLALTPVSYTHLLNPAVMFCDPIGESENQRKNMLRDCVCGVVRNVGDGDSLFGSALDINDVVSGRKQPDILQVGAGFYNAAVNQRFVGKSDFCVTDSLGGELGRRPVIVRKIAELLQCLSLIHI